MSAGPIMIDLQGTELSGEDRDLIKHPNTGGVILFARNYTDPRQLVELTGEIRQAGHTQLIIGVDHEGGRIQRFRDGFTRLPPCGKLGEMHDRDAHASLKMAELTGWLMAVELLAVGVDFSFAPVLDLDTGNSAVIGDRAFHADPDTVSNLGRAFTKGMRDAGMAAVGKHFPGHGHVREDSHVDVPTDNRTFEDIQMADLIPFERLVNAGIAGVMPAHVIYSQVDDRPAGFSPIWLQEVLRSRFGFQGAVFSDDISMAGAEVAGNPVDRANAALDAGCDMVLVCNDRASAVQVLESIEVRPRPLQQVRLMRMHGKPDDLTLDKLKAWNKWKLASESIVALDDTPELDLDDDQLHA